MNRRTYLRQSGGIAGIVFGIGQASVSGAERLNSPTVDEKSHEPLGHVEIDGATEAVVGDDGETVYVGGTDGFATVDVTDPTDPTVLADIRNPPEQTDQQINDIYDVKVDGDRLVVPGPANQTAADEFHGFALYDVSDPADPVLATERYETDHHIHNCFLDGTTLYLVGNFSDGNPLVVIDISDDDPVEIGRWSLLDFDEEWADVPPILWYLHDVYVHADIAYLAYWNAGTFLVDVTEPAEPSYLSHVAQTEADDFDGIEDEPGEVSGAQLGLPGNDHYATVDDSGDLMGIGRESWSTGGDPTEGAGGIDLYDVSDPTNPTELSSIEPPETEDATRSGGMWTTAHNFELRDGKLFSSWYQGGVKIHDVSDPESPQELAHWEDRETAAFWTARVVQPGETYVASSTEFVPGVETEGALYTFPIVSDGGDSNGTDENDQQQDEGNGENGPGEGGDNDRSEDTDSDEAIPGLTGLAGVVGIAGTTALLGWLHKRGGER